MYKLLTMTLFLMTILLSANCSSSSTSSSAVSDAVSDADSDGIADANDACSENPSGFTSTNANDADQDGCQDSSEDIDDNNDGIIEISTAEELNNIRYTLAGLGYQAGADATESVSGCPSTGCSGYILVNSISLTDLTGNWVPIGDGTTDNAFATTLDGGGYTISNLTISSDQLVTGFIAVLKGTVKNLTISGASVTSTYIPLADENSLTGALVGKLDEDGTIENVVSSLDVASTAGTDKTIGTNVAGGLVGSSFGIIRDSSASGNITTGYLNYNRVGGLVGWVFIGEVINSSSSGKVTDGVAGSDGSGGGRVGGLVGHNLGSIKGSYSSSTVEGLDGRDQVGGLVGVNFTGSIDSSYTKAGSNINGGAGNDQVGGLVGVNVGREVAGTYVPGIIRNSYSVTTIVDSDSNNSIGGLVGKNTNQVLNCYAINSITGGSGVDTIGGLIGDNSENTASNDVKYNYAITTILGGAEIDLMGELFGSNVPENNVSSNYTNADITFAASETEVTLAVAKSKSVATEYLNALTVAITNIDFSDTWSVLNWILEDNTKYPSLKAYVVNSSGTPVAGNLICDQPSTNEQCP